MLTLLKPPLLYLFLLYSKIKSLIEESLEASQITNNVGLCVSEVHALWPCQLWGAVSWHCRKGNQKDTNFGTVWVSHVQKHRNKTGFWWVRDTPLQGRICINKPQIEWLNSGKHLIKLDKESEKVHPRIHHRIHYQLAKLNESKCHYFQIPLYQRHAIVVSLSMFGLIVQSLIFLCRSEVLLPCAISWQVSSVYTIMSCASGLGVSFSQSSDCRSASLEPSSVTCAAASASNLDSLLNFCEQHHKKEGEMLI